MSTLQCKNSLDCFQTGTKSQIMAIQRLARFRNTKALFNTSLPSMWKEVLSTYGGCT